MNLKNDILNIAMNLTRIGNWAADDFTGKERRINQFLEQTQHYFNILPPLPHQLTPTINYIQQEFTKLNQLNKIENTKIWAEKMMTLGTILTHRASLL